MVFVCLFVCFSFVFRLFVFAIYVSLFKLLYISDFFLAGPGSLGSFLRGGDVLVFLFDLVLFSFIWSAM